MEYSSIDLLQMECLSYNKTTFSHDIIQDVDDTAARTLEMILSENTKLEIMHIVDLSEIVHEK